jgi:hypothetical protein
MRNAERREPDGTRSAGSRRPPGVPLWVRASGIVVVILLLVLLVAILADGGHGHGQHGTGDPDEPDRDPAAVASSVSESDGLTRQ